MKAKNIWVATLSVVFSGVVIAVAQNKLLPCMEALQVSLDIDKANAGWLSSIFSVMGICMAFPGASIVKRLGYKAAVFMSLVFSGIGTIIGLFANSAFLMLISRMIEGAGAGLIAVVVPSLINLWFPLEKRGLPTAVWSTWQYFGQTISFFVASLLLRVFHYKSVWVFGLFLTVCAVLCCWLLVPATENDQSYQPNSLGKENSVRDAMPDFRAWCISAGMMFFCFSSFGFVSWGASFWAEQLEMSLTVANLYLSLFAVLALPVVIGIGFILDRVELRRFTILAFLFYSLVVGIAFILPSKRLVLPFVVIYAVSEAILPACLYTLLPRTAKAPSQIPFIMGLITLTSNLGMLLGAPVCGRIIEKCGWSGAALAVAISSVVGTATVAFACSKIKK